MCIRDRSDACSICHHKEERRNRIIYCRILKNGTTSVVLFFYNIKGDQVSILFFMDVHIFNTEKESDIFQRCLMDECNYYQTVLNNQFINKNNNYYYFKIKENVI